MSLLSTARSAARTDDPALPTPDDKWYDQLVQLIPAEAVALFTGLIAFCAGNDWGWTVRWLCFAFVAAFAVSVIFLGYWNELTPARKQAKGLPLPWWAMFVGVASFAVWAATLPETPFLQWHSWDLKFAPLITAVAAAALTKGNALHRAWRERHPLNSSS